MKTSTTRSLAFVGLFFAAALSVALASKPKPKDCDSWKCGPSCAPAKYVAVRVPPRMLPLFGSQLYSAAILEGGIGLLAFGLVRISSERRRRAEERSAPISASEPAES
ncbi:MAG: hypothetical protein M3167_02320 [Acidobacteriota bacterium]|nr:hypothetical protein [Acidobacteriota bacterium]